MMGLVEIAYGDYVSRKNIGECFSVIELVFDNGKIVAVRVAN